MDAFAVSIGKGLTVKKLRGLDAFKTALWFGGFQALFPLLGVIGRQLGAASPYPGNSGGWQSSAIPQYDKIHTSGKNRVPALEPGCKSPNEILKDALTA